MAAAGIPAGRIAVQVATFRFVHSAHGTVEVTMAAEQSTSQSVALSSAVKVFRV